MAAPKPSLQFKLFSIPSNVTYRDSHWNGEDADIIAAFTALGASRTGARNIYTYISGATMDYWLRAASGVDPYTLLAEIDDATTFSASLEMNEVSTWSVTKEFALGDPRSLALLQAASTPGAWSAWHISTEDDSPEEIANFLQGTVLNTPAPSANPLLFPTSATPTFADEAGTPAFLARGGGGPVQQISVEITERSESITIAGTSWAKLLQQTVHLNDVFDPPTAVQGGASGFQQLVSDVLLANSEYALTQLTEDEIAKLGTDEYLADVKFRTDLGSAGIEAATAFRTKTPVAIFTIISAVRASARTRLDAEFPDTPFIDSKGGIVKPGSHNLLRTFQRLAERTGLFFLDNMPLVLWDAPPTTTIEWGPGDYFTASPRLYTPQATAWITSHVDQLRNWDVYTPDVDLIAAYGEIQASNLSTAVRALSAEADIFTEADIAPTDQLPGETAEEAARRFSGQIIIQQIKAQNAGLAISEANNISVGVDLKWNEGTRYGIDWKLGDRVRVISASGMQFPDPDVDAGLEIRKVTIALAQGGQWSFKAGLGPRSNVLPGFRIEPDPNPYGVGRNG